MTNATSVVNGGVSGQLNPGFGGARAPIATATSVVRKTNLSCSLGDALSAQVSYGFDQVTGSARVVMPTSGASLNSGFTVSMGAGNNANRFNGTLRQIDTMLAPHAVTAVGKGPLVLLEEFKNNTESSQAGQTKPGLDFADLLQGQQSGTLQQVVTAVLNMVGISYSLGNFANPSNVYGLDMNGNPTWNDALIWGTHETAAAYLHRFFEASAGYRLFDSSDGSIYLKQITATPAGTPDATFTLGVDIFGNSLASSSSLGQQSAVLVEGWDDGSGPATSGVVGSSSQSAYRVFSPLIETDTQATAIANFWLSQVSRPQQIVRLSTPRDDLLGPGSTVFINAPGLGTVMQMWVKSITSELALNGQFTQHLVCVAS